MKRHFDPAMNPSRIKLPILSTISKWLLLAMMVGSPLLLVQQGSAQFDSNRLNPDPGTGTEDYDQDEESEKPYEEEEQGDSTEEDGTNTNEDGEETPPSQDREAGPGNTANPSPLEDPDECDPPSPYPTGYDPDSDPYPDPFDYPDPEEYPTNDDYPVNGSFSIDFDLFGPGALSKGSVRFFTHEFRNPGRVALDANVPPNFTVNKTSLPHPDDAAFSYWRLNSIDTGAMKIEFADAPAALLALDPNAFTVTEKNSAGQQTRKTTISFVDDGGTKFFRMDVEEFGGVTRHQQTSPELNKLVLETGSYAGNAFSPLRRVTTVKNYDNPQVRKERITIEERPTVTHAYQVVSDRELWREVVIKQPSDLEIPGLGVGIVGGGSGGAGSNSSRPQIPLGSPKAYVTDSVGKFYLRHTPHHYWRVVREIIDPDGAQPLTNVWEYWRSSERNDPDFTRYSTGQLKSYLMHDGRRGRFTYALNRDTVKTPYAGDPEGMLTVAEWDPGMRTRTVTSTVGGEILSRVVTAHTQSTLHRARSMGPEKIQVSHFYFVPDNQMFGGMPTLIKAPDGTLTTFAYSRTAVGGIQTIMERGATDNDMSVSEGLRTTTVTNSRGHVVFSQQQAIGHDDADGRIYGRMAVTAVDSRGRPTATAHHPQSFFPETGAEMGDALTVSNPAWVTSIVRFCCGPTSATDRNGITTFYAYDGLKRLIKTHRLGVTTETLRTGLTTETYRYPETVSASLIPGFNGAATDLVSKTVRNLTDTLMESWSPDPSAIDQQGQGIPGELAKTKTETTFQPAPGLSTRTVTTTADNFSQTEDSFLDGRTAKTYGALSPAMEFTYAVNETGEITTQSYLDGITPRETSTTQSDWADRTIQTATGANVLNYVYFGSGADRGSRHKLRSVTDADNVKTLYGYNDRGERTLTAIDLNRNDQPDYGADTIEFSETVPAYETIAPATVDEPVWKTTRKVWQDDQTSPTGGTTVSTRLSSTNGLRTSVQSIAVGKPSFQTLTLQGNRSWKITTTNPDGTKQAQQYTAGLLASSTSLRTDNSPLFGYSYTYDEYNRPVSQADSRTGLSQIHYRSDTADVVSGVTEPGNRTTAYTYDVRGRRTATTLPDETVTSTTYTPRDEVATQSGSQTYPTVHTYDYAGRMKTLTTSGTAGNVITAWNYSTTTGDLISKRYDSDLDGTAGSGPSYHYTDAGRLKTRTWAGGKHTRYDYDFGGRLAHTRYFTAASWDDGTNAGNDPETPDISATHDALGRIKDVARNGALHARYTYRTSDLKFLSERQQADALDQTLTYTFEDGQNNTLAGRYNGYSSTAASASYTYGATDGRISSISNPQLSNVSFSYNYVPDSSLIESITGPAHTVTNTWEPTRNVLATKINATTAGAVSSFRYTVNDIGQREAVGPVLDQNNDPMSTYTPAWDWSYNPRGELTEAEDKNGTAYRAYEYDSIGNRTKAIEALAADLAAAPNNFVANALNQYSTITNPQSVDTNPVHDSDGNLKLDGGINKDSQDREYIWDGENRLIGVKRSDTGATLVTYQYDHYSRLISRSAAGETTRYFYEGWNRIAEYRETGTGHELEKSYVWGTDMSGSIQGAGGVGGLLMVSEISDSQISNYHPTYDGNGNVTEYLDANGTPVAHYEYDPFGRTTVASGSKANDFAHRFSTKPFDEVTGWYYYGYRFYDPVTGRWPSRDPIEEAGGINLYAFVGNSPINLVDIDGRGWFGAVTGGIAGAWAGATSGAATGATVGGVGGTFVAPGPGTLVGGGGGGLIGGIIGGIGGGVAGAIGGHIIEEAGKSAREAYDNMSESSECEDGEEGEKEQERNPAQDKKLDDKEADKAAKEAGYKDAHEAKEQNGAKPPSRYDLYKGKDGKTYVKPKGGNGPGEPIN